jgi:hypothetical protein
VRVAVRAQINAHSHEEPENSSLNLLDEVWTAFCARWFDAPIAILAVVVLLMWFEGLDVVSELSLVWQLQGPIISGI